MKKILLIIIFMMTPVIFLYFFKSGVKAMENNNIKYIIIDPGHGGIDGGGISSTGVYEKEINLKVSYYLKKYLENSGYSVILTRYGDYDLASKNSKNRKNEDINKRLQIINKDNVILYISIHCNMYSNSSITGAQTFYNSSNKENKLLAEKVQSKIKTILKNTKREIKSITGKYLVDNAKATGVLVELGFLSNETEFNLLNSLSYQEKIAYCIYIGIIDYLG